eukprot:366290-Chlamydomonas_euryale.AAC.2
MTPSGVPPMPIMMSTPAPALAVSIAPATSPSLMKRMREPASRISLTSSCAVQSHEKKCGKSTHVHTGRWASRASVWLAHPYMLHVHVWHMHAGMCMRHKLARACMHCPCHGQLHAGRAGPDMRGSKRLPHFHISFSCFPIRARALVAGALLVRTQAPATFPQSHIPFPRLPDPHTQLRGVGGSCTSTSANASPTSYQRPHRLPPPPECPVCCQL